MTFTPPGAAARKVTEIEAKRAAERLFLRFEWRGPLSSELVRSEFRARLREAHPDAGGDAIAAPDRLKELTAARDTLLAWLAQAPKADCSECGGTGFVSGKFAVKPCSRCG